VQSELVHNFSKNDSRFFQTNITVISTTMSIILFGCLETKQVRRTLLGTRETGLSRWSSYRTLCSRLRSCLADFLGKIKKFQGYRSRCSNSLRARQSGDRIQTGLGPPSLLCSEYRVISGCKVAGGGVNHPPHLTPRLKKE
jgi:hypothetical protein